MPSDRFPQTFWGLTALAAAIAFSALVLGGSAVKVKRAGDAITVTGSAKRPIRSDFVIWRASVSSHQPSLTEAYPELKRHADRVRAYLASKGVADSNLTTRPMETQPIPEVMNNGRETGRTAGYRLTQTFEVRSFDVEAVTRLAQQANEVIQDGVPLVSQPPEYLYTKLADVRTVMLGEATKDARTRAESIARAAGSDIGAVREVRMGVFQITPRNSTEVNDYGINDTSSLEKDITAVVRVTFAVK